MTIYDLNKEQMLQLKQNYLTNHLLEVEDRTPSWGELADADELVGDDIIFDNYSCYEFVEEDFF